MIDSTEVVGNLLKLSKTEVSKFKDYQVLIGFSGFGNVGFLAITHFVEILSNELQTVGFWGNSSWFHEGKLESIITVYKHEKSKSLLVITRLPLHVSSVPQRFWEQLSQDILHWGARRYIIVGGLREETRRFGSTAWAAFAPTPEWTKQFHDERTFGDRLAMIGPLSYLLMHGQTLNLPVLGLLAYCNDEEDQEAALFAVKELNKLCGFNLPEPDYLIQFNYSFIPGGQDLYQFDGVEDTDDGDDEDDVPGYDLSDLV